MKTIAMFLLAAMIVSVFAGVVTWMVMLLVLGRPVLLDLVGQLEVIPRWGQLGFAAALSVIPNLHRFSLFAERGLREWVRVAVSMPCSLVAGLILGYIQILHAYSLVPQLPAGFQRESQNLPSQMLFAIPCLVCGLVIYAAMRRATRSLSR